VADSRAEQSPEVGWCTDGSLRVWSLCWRSILGTCDRGEAILVELDEQIQRQEGTGAGNGVRLRERSKALKGEPHERIRHETRSAGTGRMKTSRGCENLEA
jgi:hypothetical protein